MNILPAVQETRFHPWVRKISLEEETATHSSIFFFFHSSILAWNIPWTEEPGGQQFTGLQRVTHN